MNKAVIDLTSGMIGMLVLLAPSGAAAAPAPVAAWHFESGAGGLTADAASGIRDTVHGNHRYEGKGARGNCLKLDGFATRVERAAHLLPELRGGFAVEAWVALQEYPWNWTAIADCQREKKAGFFFGLDHQGAPGMAVAAGGRWIECFNVGNSDSPHVLTRFVPLHVWSHVVGSYDPDEGISLYLNGERVGFTEAKGNPDIGPFANLLLGGGHEQLFPVNTERGPSMLGSPMLLSGLLDEVRIHPAALSAAEVKGAFASIRPAVPKPLDYELMPTGPPGTGEFGASMEELKYSESWDGNYRMRGPSDVVVKFDGFPFNYVFWRGWNYGPCMVTENGLLMADQSVERSNENGCTEHMSDKQNRYSHIRIVENSDARVVLCWRYNPCDIFYKETNVDPATGWGDWAEEYFHIYPDGLMMREQRFYTTGEVERKRVGGFGGWPSNQETIFFNQPGKGPLDTVEVAALTVANDAGESRTFSWQPEFPGGVGREPADPTIQMVNFRSKYRPFMVKLPGARIAAFPPSGHIDRNFPYWNHWPTAQLPNDGRQATRTDRPAHTSLSWFCDPPVREEGILFTWTYMYGLTTARAAELATLSKSWNSPAALKLTGDGFTGGGFDTCQRAYLLQSGTPENPQPLAMTLAASESSPVVNPAFVVRGWGDRIPAITLNGKPLARGANCRIGLNHRLDGTDLVVWLKLQSTAPVSLNLSNPP